MDIKPIDKFNNCAFEFLGKLETYFPKEPKISGYKMIFLSLSRLQPAKPLNMFMESLEPYGFQILSQDSVFTKSTEFFELVEILSGNIGLVKYWGDLSELQVTSILENILVLYILGMEALGKYEQLEKTFELIKESRKNE